MEEVIGSNPLFSTKVLGNWDFFMPYYIYILYSRKVDRYYVGETENIETRLNAHLTGISTYTSMADDWKVVQYPALNS